MEGYSNATTVTLAAATVTNVMPARVGVTKRIVYSISNTGANAAYIFPSNTQVPVAGSGILLNAGSTITDSQSENYTCWSGTINAISTGGTTLAVFERVE